MRAEVLAAQPQDWRAVARACAGGEVAPGCILYQKHMTHHMLPEFGLDWMDSVEHAFLIRAPERVVASYVAKREEVTLDGPRLRPAGRTVRPGGAARRDARRRSSTPRRSAPTPRASCAGSAPRSGFAFDRRHAGLAGRSPPERRRLGGALVRGGERVDRLRGRRSRRRRPCPPRCAGSPPPPGLPTSAFGCTPCRTQLARPSRPTRGIGALSAGRPHARARSRRPKTCALAPHARPARGRPEGGPRRPPSTPPALPDRTSVHIVASWPEGRGPGRPALSRSG